MVASLPLVFAIFLSARLATGFMATGFMMPESSLSQFLFCRIHHDSQSLVLHAKKYVDSRVSKAGGGVPQMPSGDSILFDPSEEGMLGGTSDLMGRLQAGADFHQHEESTTNESSQNIMEEDTAPKMFSSGTFSGLPQRKVNNLGVPIPIPSSMATYPDTAKGLSQQQQQQQHGEPNKTEQLPTKVSERKVNNLGIPIPIPSSIATYDGKTIIISTAESIAASSTAAVNGQTSPATPATSTVEKDVKMLHADPPLLSDDERQGALPEATKPVTTSSVPQNSGWGTQDNWWDKASVGSSYYETKSN